jgi:glutamyl-tRNA synthetase
MKVRVRYAPSPTGLQHIGGVRTALFNYFFARSAGGAFVLRVEDTDQERFDPRALEDIYETFAWLGISWDEGPDVGGDYGPYVQSERVELYRKHADRLVDAGKAYWAYDTAEELEAMRAAQGGKGPGYDRRGRDRSAEENERRKADGVPGVVRFKVPLEGTTETQDLVLGRIKRKNADIPPDPVLLKSDGFPTYHLANVIDDHSMEISHILRAQEWVPSAALHVQLYRAFGWEPPHYCHLPMVLGKDGQKLSKRHGATQALEFRKAGYLAEAVLNYVTLLGWSYDDKREFFTKSELEGLFSLEKINKAPAVFDYKKLEWFNGNYIRELSPEELYRRILPFLVGAELVSDPPTEAEENTIMGALPLIHERLKLLSDAPDLLRFILTEPATAPPEEFLGKKMTLTDAYEYLKIARELIVDFDSRSQEENEELFRQKAEEIDAKIGQLLTPLRVAVTGSKVSPPLFGSIALLGSEAALRRVDAALTILKNEELDG